MSQSIDISSLDIKDLIVHDIPKHKKGNDEVRPKLSQQVSTLPLTLRSFFKQKISQAFRSEKSITALASLALGFRQLS